ncbi:MAG: branched-chain amino acid ABC transporter substrate-binding protein [Burkholderiales bacterium]|nr:MAG: branched-chain amino acid ABC transporter substrate-binding protein [Burkholderiales bacterium]
MKPLAALMLWASLTGGVCLAQPPVKVEAKGPIKVGAVSSMALFPEATAAVRTYFATINDAGGIRGRKLELIIEDDKIDPKTAAMAARKLVEQDQVVANVGSASALECAVNAAYYGDKNMVSIQGTGVDPVCFDSPNIAPVNTGPYVGTAVALKFLADVRRRQRICAVTVGYAPSQKAAFEQIIDEWKKKSGRNLAYVAIGIAPTDSLAEQVKKAVEAKCDGLVFTAIDSGVIDWVKTARSMKANDIDWVFLTPAYTQDVADTLKAEGEGIFAISEFEPWSSRSGMLTDWRNTMLKGRVPLTSLSQGGYVAASVFVTALRGIEGDITRESVTKAFKSMEPRKVSLMGSPFSFGPAPRHNPNRAAIPVRLEGGKWRVAHWEYITYQ